MPPSPRQTQRLRPAATIVELIIFLAVLSIVIFAVLPLLFSAVENRILQQTMSKVEQNGALALQSIGYHLRTSRNILSPAPASPTGRVVAVQMGSGSLDPTIIGIQTGSLVIIRRVVKQVITSSDVAIDGFVIRNTSASDAQQSFLVSFRMSRNVPFGDNRAYSRTFQTVFTLPPKAGPVETPCSYGAPTCDEQGTPTFRWEFCDGSATFSASTPLDCADPAGGCCTDGTCADDVTESACLTGGGSFYGGNACTAQNCQASDAPAPNVYCCDNTTDPSHPQCAATPGPLGTCGSGIFALSLTDCNDSCTVCGDGYKGAAEECEPPDPNCNADCTMGEAVSSASPASSSSSISSSASSVLPVYCCDKTLGTCPTEVAPGACPSGITDADQAVCDAACPVTVQVHGQYCSPLPITYCDRYMGRNDSVCTSAVSCPDNSDWDCEWNCPSAGTPGPFGDGNLNRCMYAYECVCRITSNTTGEADVTDFLSCFDRCTAPEDVDTDGDGTPDGLAQLLETCNAICNNCAQNCTTYFSQEQCSSICNEVGSDICAAQ